MMQAFQILRPQPWRVRSQVDEKRRLVLRQNLEGKRVPGLRQPPTPDRCAVPVPPYPCAAEVKVIFQQVRQLAVA
jgi:hypothetical protein